MAVMSTSEMLKIAFVPCSEGCAGLCMFDKRLEGSSGTAMLLTGVKVIDYVTGSFGGIVTLVTVFGNVVASNPNWTLTRNFGLATLAVVSVCKAGALGLAKSIQNTVNSNAENSPLTA